MTGKPTTGKPTSARPTSAPRAQLAAVALVAVAGAALLLPWWRAARAPVLLVAGPTRALDADTWPGWEIVGPPRTALLAVLAVAALAAALRRLPALAPALTTAAGATAAAAGVAALAGRGVTAAPGAWVTAVAGAGAVLLCVAGSPVLVLLALVVALAVPLLPGAPPRPDAGRTAGPFVRLAGLDAPDLRGGGGLPAPLSPGARLVTVQGAVAVVAEQGLVAPDAAGRAQVLARIPDRDRGRSGGVIGVAGDRVARWTDVDSVAVTGLRAGDPVAVLVRGVGGAGPVGADGSVWLRAIGDPPGAVRRLSLAAYDGEQALAATFLPVVTIGVPDGVQPLDARTLLPVPGGALRFVAQESGHRLERIVPTPAGVDVAVLAGGLDATCGATRAAREAYLPSASPLAVDADGGAWFVLGAEPGALVRLGPDGLLRAVPAPLPGTAMALAVAGDGSVVLALRDTTGPALWRLPAAATALTDLPATAPGCVAAPPRVGAPVRLVPVGTTGADALGIPLDVAGRWASGRRGDTTELAAVTADGRRVPLGVRRDGDLGPVWPDGTGGIWWLESPGDAATPLTLVHGRPGGTQERMPAVAHPAPREGATLITDLGGRPPLLGTAVGAYRIEGGRTARVVGGVIRGGVVRADGRGWILADGRLLALDGDRVLGPVIDAGDRRGEQTAPAVQLAKGVPPDRLALSRASVGLDAGGRAVVVCDGVVLAVDDAGAVTVVAQDPRLDAPYTVEGGLVEYADGTLLRVDLPG